MCDFNLPNNKLRNEPDGTSDNLPDNIAGKLIAWLDGELSDHEAVLVERHVRACAECRSRVEAYERVSSALNAYCDAVVASKATDQETPQPARATQTPKATQATLRRWAPVLAGAAAAAGTLFLAFPRTRPRIQIDRPLAPPQAAAVSPATAPESLESLMASAPAPATAPVTPLVTPAKTVRKPHAAQPEQAPNLTPTQKPTQKPGQTREPAPAPSRAPRPSQIRDAGWVPASPAIRIAIPAEAMFPPGAVPEGVNFTADFSIAADGSAAPLRLQPRPSGTPVGTQVHYERKPTQP